jgi:hypothetical protein
MVNLESERVIRENGIYYLLCSAVQNNPNSGNFIASEAAICNRNSNVANDGSHILCHQDGAEDCDKSISVMVKIQDPVIRDSVLVDAAPKSTQGGHSQGVFASGVFNLRILNNVIDNNGWYADRNGDEEGSRRSTIFNHNLYLQHGSGPSVIKGNISARASSHGLQARAGAVLEENVFMRNPLSFFVADGGYGDLANATSYVIDNVVLEGNDINDDTPRGFGGEHNTARQSEFRDNIFAHLVPEVSEHNNLALKVGCDQNADILCSGYFEGNIVFGWEASNGRGTALEIGDDGVGLHADDQLIFVNNSFHLRGSHSASKLISLRNGALFNNPRYTFIGGSYSSPDLAGGASADLFKDTAQTVSTADWQDEGASLSDTNSFPDTCRTAASYYYKNALDGDDSEACTIMHDNELFEAFMQMARQRKQRFTPAGPFTTAQFLEYVRAGFGK